MWRRWNWGLFPKYSRYNENRYKVSEIRDYFQKYKDTAIPEFIYKRARSALEHCINRTHHQTDFSKVKNLGHGMYQVHSFSNPHEHYDVTLGTRSASCDCPDFPKKKRPCKHIMTIFMMLPKGSWADVLDEVRLNPTAIIGCEDGSEQDDEDEEDDDYDYYRYGNNYYQPRYNEGNIRYTQAQMKAPGFFKIFPEFLNKRPSAFIKHCMWRTRYRSEIGDIQKLQDGSFKVQSLTNRSEYYQVNLGPVSASPPNPSCNCPDWEKKGLPCKHILAILMYYEEKSDEDKTKKTTVKPTSAAASEKDKGSKATKAAGRPKKEAVKRTAKCKANAIGAVKTEIKTEIKTEGPNYSVKNEIKKEIKMEPNWTVYPVKTEIKMEPNWTVYPVETEIKQELKTEPNCAYYPLKGEIKKEVE